MMRGPGPRSADGGFSLVELIVVLGIMAVLMATGLPALLGLMNVARDASVRSDLGNDRAALVGYGIDNNGKVPSKTGFNPGSNGLNLVGYGWTASSTPAPVYDDTNPPGTTGAPGATWCLQMLSASGTTFRASTNTAVASGSCATLGTSRY